MFSLLFSVAVCQGLTNEGKYEFSESVLKNITPQRQDINQYSYLRTVNNYFLNNIKESKEFSKNYEGFQEDTQQRRKAIVEMIRNEIKSLEQLASSKDPESKLMFKLDDIARDMRFVKQRLENYDSKKDTQKRQDIIVKKLDDMIQEKIDNMTGKGEGKPSDGDKQKGEFKNLPDSFPMQDMLGKGEVDNKKLQELAKNWGNLPQKDKEKALISISKDYPPRYRKLIEDYFKSLSRYQEK